LLHGVNITTSQIKAKTLSDSGVIWNITPYETPVIPANAGIQSVGSAFPKAGGVDSRFRGNDCGLERPFLANNTTTLFRNRLPMMQEIMVI
jgi:hypothetical protein